MLGKKYSHAQTNTYEKSPPSQKLFYLGLFKKIIIIILSKYYLYKVVSKKSRGLIIFLGTPTVNGPIHKNA